MEVAGRKRAESRDEGRRAAAFKLDAIGLS